MTSTSPKTARPPRGERARLIMDTATWCYLGALFVVCWNLWSMGVRSLLTWVVVLSAPSAASLLFVLASMLIPSLHAVGRIRFPLNFTLPAVYCALLLMCVVLGTHVGSSILEISDPMKVMVQLLRPLVLVEVYAAGCGLLTLASLRKPAVQAPSEPEEGATVDSQ